MDLFLLIYLALTVMFPRPVQVCVEALACECPVIAADLPATREIVMDGKTGMVFRQGDSADLSRKILTLLAEPSLRKSMGEAGRRYVAQRFDWQIITRSYRDLLDNTIQRKI